MRWMVLIAALGLLGAVPSAASAQKAELARYQRAAIRGLGRLEEPAAFEQAFKGKTQEEARASGAQLAARGVVRLSAEDLKYRAELLVDFTGRANTKTCGKWSRGGVSGEEVIAMIAQLDSVALDEWVDLSLRAAMAEVRQKPALSNIDNKRGSSDPFFFVICNQTAKGGQHGYRKVVDTEVAEVLKRVSSGGHSGSTQSGNDDDIGDVVHNINLATKKPKQ